MHLSWKVVVLDLLSLFRMPLFDVLSWDHEAPQNIAGKQQCTVSINAPPLNYITTKNEPHTIKSRYIAVIYYTLKSTLNNNYNDKTSVKFVLTNDTPYPASYSENNDCDISRAHCILLLGYATSADIQIMNPGKLTILGKPFEVELLLLAIFTDMTVLFASEGCTCIWYPQINLFRINMLRPGDAIYASVNQCGEKHSPESMMTYC